MMERKDSNAQLWAVCYECPPTRKQPQSLKVSKEAEEVDNIVYKH